MFCFDRMFDYVDIVTDYFIIELISSSHNYKKSDFGPPSFVLSFLQSVIVCEVW